MMAYRRFLNYKAQKSQGNFSAFNLLQFSVLTQVLQCIYTGEIEVDTGNIAKYYDVAKVLDIQGLLEALSMAIKER